MLHVEDWTPLRSAAGMTIVTHLYEDIDNVFCPEKHPDEPCAIDPMTIMTVIEPGSKEKNLVCLARWKNKTTKTLFVVFVHYWYW